MKSLRIAAVAFAAASLNCGGTEPDFPKLCVILSDAAAGGGGAGGGEACGATADGTTRHCADDFTVTEGQGLIILHELPAGIVTDKSLHLTLETPCTKVESDHKHTVPSDASCAPEVRIPVAAPPGASCSLVITASIANHAAQRISRSTNCTNIDAVCNAVKTDPGVGGSGGGN